MTTRQSIKSLFCWWEVRPSGRRPVRMPASCPRLAAHAWASEALHVGESTTVTVVFDDAAPEWPTKVKGVTGPYRVERLARDVAYAGAEGDLRPAPRWRLRSRA